MIVLDASLATKIVVEEADSEVAERWFRETAHEIRAPDLIAIEVAQAVVRRVSDRQVALESGQRSLRAWRTLLEGGGIVLIRSDPRQIDVASELAMRLGHPVKDCLYLALAIEADCDLATCDAKFAGKARTIHPKVKLLADYGD